MESFNNTISDARTMGVARNLPYTGLTSSVASIDKTSEFTDSSAIGVSTKNVSARISLQALRTREEEPQWFALRATYGRVRKAHEYLSAHGIESFLPMQKVTRLSHGKRIVTEEPYIPNIFFARGTEEEMKEYVYDNVNLPFLRFYYRHLHVGTRICKEPLIVPDRQLASLRIICEANQDDAIMSLGEIEKFQEGQKVRIIDGKFKGVEGVIARYRSQQRVGVVIDGLMTICTAYVPSAFIETTE